MVERSATTRDYFTCDCDLGIGNKATRFARSRLAAQIVHLASTFSSNVSLAFRGRKADARNVLAVMLLAASVGSTISIEASGPDEAEALDALTSLIGGR